MIYLTGDCHGDFRKFSKSTQKEQRYNIEDNSYVIVTGDFGLLWSKDKEFEYNLNWLSSLPFTILWVQGNHENYDMIKEYPLEVWNGGKVRKMSNNIILLERGQIFNLEEQTFFTFGGASSHDIAGGILDMSDSEYDVKRRKAIKSGLPYRVMGKSWWSEELPTQEEMQEGMANLIGSGNQVDYVITHCLPSSMIAKLASWMTYDCLTDYLNVICKTVSFKHWFCGHYHVEGGLEGKYHILYNSIVSLEDYK